LLLPVAVTERHDTITRAYLANPIEQAERLQLVE
jgi:hypothetical protein